MAPDYRWSDGEDVTLGSLTVLDPQPSADPVGATQRTFAADSSVFDQGLFTIWRWSHVENETEYQSILSTLGIQNATTNRGTCYTRSQDGSYVRFNATAVRPNAPGDISQRDYLLRGVEIVLKDLELAS